MTQRKEEHIEASTIPNVVFTRQASENAKHLGAKELRNAGITQAGRERSCTTTFTQSRKKGKECTSHANKLFNMNNITAGLMTNV